MKALAAHAALVAARVSALVAALALAGAAHAASPQFCTTGRGLAVDDKDRRLQFSAALRQLLDQSGHALAVMSRSGVDLGPLGLRYSHAGISLRQGPPSPWAVRQLYYACDESRPRLFDQGLAAFVLAADESPVLHVSLLLLPPGAEQALEAAALDTATALALLGGRYNAAAYPFDGRYQNCNQWLAELLAVAQGASPSRGAAQAWLQASGYRGQRLEPPPWMFLAAPFVPLLHLDDQPPEALGAGRVETSLPASIEAWLRERVPGLRRVELCHDRRHIVVREGWQPLDEACEGNITDRRIAFVH